MEIEMGLKLDIESLQPQNDWTLFKKKDNYKVIFFTSYRNHKALETIPGWKSGASTQGQRPYIEFYRLP